MYSAYSGRAARNAREEPLLRQIFDRYAEETITDEQARRVFEPVGRLIREGRFHKRRRPQAARVFASIAAVLVVAVAMAVAAGERIEETFVLIPESEIPLAAPAFAAVPLSGRIQAGGEGVAGVSLTLFERESGAVAGTAVTDADGAYSFAARPDTAYRLEAVLPGGMAAAKRGGAWILQGSEAELTFFAENEELWEGVEIEVCSAQ